MLKKVTVLDIDTKQLKTEVLNTNKIYSVCESKEPGILHVNYDGRIYKVKEPLDGFIARLNSDLGDEANNRFKSLESELERLKTFTKELDNALRSTQNKLIESINAANTNVDRMVDEFKLVEYKKKPKRKKPAPNKRMPKY